MKTTLGKNVSVENGYINRLGLDHRVFLNKTKPSYLSLNSQPTYDFYVSRSASMEYN